MLFYITLTVLLASSQAKFWTDCGSKLASVQSVGVSGCAEDAKECVLKRNTNATISIDFTPSQDVKGLQTIVHGVIMNLPVPFPMPQPDACKDNNLSCPLPAGKEASYRTTMPVLKSYPKVKVDVKWELKNDEEEDLVCVMIPARIN
ncbi:ecdysteroid-regulated 16 kDa protein-like [Anticarsia gemmatalis]|uniref:ecdysteroid-regulated 16 kDa protein-like n=1 Tax=Anticarsia gemmatalis TaxID=129554 RepID=UPI003F763C86